MRRSQHFRSHWKELLAHQAAAADDSNEAAAGEVDDGDESGFPALALVRRHRREALLACLGVLAMCAAIVNLAPHGSPTPRRPLYGRVQADGLDLTRGSITFLPAPGNSGPAASTSIVDGKYRFTDQAGPSDGPHRVLVDLHSLPEDDVPVAEQSLPDASSGGLLALLEGNAVSGSATGEEQPRGRVEHRWELEYTVPVRGRDRKDFEL